MTTVIHAVLHWVMQLILVKIAEGMQHESFIDNQIVVLANIEGDLIKENRK